MEPTESLLESLGVSRSTSMSRTPFASHVDLFPVTTDPLGATALPPSSPELVLYDDGYSEPLSNGDDEATSAPEAVSSWVQMPLSSKPVPYEDVPATAELYPGETLVDRPIPAKRVRFEGGLTHMDVGMVYVTSIRLVWEPEPALPGSKVCRVGACLESVELMLHSIDRLRKLKSSSGLKGEDSEQMSFEGSERVGAGVSIRRTLSGNGVRRGNLEVEIHLKWGSWPGVRLSLDEPSYGRLHASLSEATLNAPSKAAELRADIRRCFAVSYSASLKASALPVAPWSLYDAEEEFQRQVAHNSCNKDMKCCCHFIPCM